MGLHWAHRAPSRRRLGRDAPVRGANSSAPQRPQLGLFALAGCGGSASSSPSPSPAKSGGTLIFGMLTTVLASTRKSGGMAQNTTASPTLSRDSSASTPTPGTAARPRAVAARDVQRGNEIHLQAPLGSQFQNGQPLTAEDVKFSFERLVSPALAAETGSLFTVPPIKGMAEVLNGKSKTLSGITTPDSQTVVFDFDTPDSAFVDVITYPSTGVVPKALVEEIGQKKFNWAPIGTGPYRIKVVDPSTQIVLERNRALLEGRRAKHRSGRVESRRGARAVGPSHRGRQAGPDVRANPVRQSQHAANPVSEAGHHDQPEQLLLAFAQHQAAGLAKLEVRQAIAQAINKDHLLQVIGASAPRPRGGIFFLRRAPTTRTASRTRTTRRRPRRSCRRPATPTASR